jgi:uncharacterized protein (DUF433 family)
MRLRAGAARKENDIDWRKRIVVDAEILVGRTIIKGTRIPVEFMVDLLARGWTTEQVLEKQDSDAQNPKIR